MSQDPDFQLFTSLRYDPILLQSPINTQSWPLPSPSPSPFYMLPYHRDRLLQAATHFNWPSAISSISGPSGFENLLQHLTTTIDIQSSIPLRIRVLLSHAGTLTIESNPVPPVPLSNLFPTRLPPPSTSSPPQPAVSALTGGALTLGPTDHLPGDPGLANPWPIIPDPARTQPSSYTLYKTTSRSMYNIARERAGIKEMTEKKEVLIISEKEGEIMEGSLTSVFFWREGKWRTPGVESGGQVGTTRRWAIERGLCTEGVVKVDSLTEGEECWVSNGVRGFIFGKVQLPPS
ncbi:aminodeoxychorismate lyase protein [Rutstroemia sp. NJR-2017a BBW]|nr:aminodeoxychorismate lyase protein [Rutstroemia sp. NJR-2017a BBW]